MFETALHGSRPEGVMRDWYVHYFLLRFCVYLFLPLTLVLVVAAVLSPLFGLGEGFGIPKVVWYGDGWKQAFAGVALTLVWAEVLLVGYLLCLRDEGGSPGPGRELPRLNRYAWAITGCFVLTLGVMIGLWWTIRSVASILAPPHRELLQEDELQALGQAVALFGLVPLEATASAWPSTLVVGRAALPVSTLHDTVWNYIWLPLGAGATMGFLALLGRARIRTQLDAIVKNFLSSLAASNQPVLQVVVRIVAAVVWGIALWLAAPGHAEGWSAWWGVLLVGACILITLTTTPPTKAPSSPGSRGRVWQKLVTKYFWALLLLVVWALALWLWWVGPKETSIAWLRGALVATVALGVRCMALRGGPASAGLALLAHFFLAYAAITWLLSQYGWWSALLGGTAIGLGLLLGMLVCFSTAELLPLWSAIRHHSTPPQGQRQQYLDQRRASYNRLAVVVLVVGLLVFTMIYYVPSLTSPVATVCSFLFVTIALIAALSLLARAIVPLTVLLLLFLGALGGLQSYKFRFDPGLDYGSLLLLDKHIIGDMDDKNNVGDIGRQQAFNAAVGAYIQAKDDLERARTRLRVANPQQVQLTQKEVDAAQEKVEKSERHLRDSWHSLQANRVLPPRLLPLADVDLRGREGRFPGAPLNLAGLLVGQPTSLPAAICWGLFVQPPGPYPLQIDDIDFLHWGPRRPVVVIAVSGGGLRAAAWALTVLQELEKQFAQAGVPDFTSHVRVITGASGGMLGAAYYTASLRPPGQRKSGQERETEMNDEYKRLTDDCLTAITNQLVFGDLPSMFSPWPSRHDRGKVLEAAWKENLNGALDASFADLWEGEKQGWRPALVFAPMLVEDGRRLLISNLDLRYPLRNDGNLLTGWAPGTPPLYPVETYSIEAFELFRLFPDRRDKFPLSTAVRMSASFPVFSPAVPLPTSPRRRVVDAGYYDNYGVSLSAAWLFSQEHLNWLDERASKIVLIQVRDGTDHSQRSLERVDPERSTWLGRSIEELASPLEGLNSARVGSSSFRNDGQLKLLSQFMKEKEQPSISIEPIAHTKRPFSVITFEFPDHASLSWYLTREERDKLRQGVNRPALQRQFKELVQWWKEEVVRPLAPP
jgi:predicted acylesterase/phospholipase RssA